MPGAILIIVTVQTVPGVKNLCTCPMTGTAANVVRIPINTSVFELFIVLSLSCLDAPILVFGAFRSVFLLCTRSRRQCERRLRLVVRRIQRQHTMTHVRPGGLSNTGHSDLTRWVAGRVSAGAQRGAFSKSLMMSACASAWMRSRCERSRKLSAYSL